MKAKKRKPGAKKRVWIRWALIHKKDGWLVETWDCRDHARAAERCYRGFGDKPWAVIQKVEVREC